MAAENAPLFADDGSRTKSPNIPGTSTYSLVMLPFRFAVAAPIFGVLYSVLLPVSWLRALYMRAFVGPVSKILIKGTRPLRNHSGGPFNYGAQLLFSEPFDEARLRAALVSVAGEDGIEEHEVDLTMRAEEPKDWPETGSWPMNHFVPDNLGNAQNFFVWQLSNIAKTKKVSWQCFNGKPGKPTVLFYHGSGNGWDGSSNFNVRRPVGYRTRLAQSAKRACRSPLAPAPARKRAPARCQRTSVAGPPVSARVRSLCAR